MTLRSQEKRLIAAARKWATFQDPDSLEDQKTDPRLAAEAIEARERLIDAVDALEQEAIRV